MSRRWGTGPVFEFEWLVASRRWQLYAVRALFVAALLFNLSVVWWAEVSGKRLATLNDLAEVGRMFFTAIAGTELFLVLLAAPAATAGAVCLDKSRGTLAHLLVTDLSNAEIILGKLAARLVPILGLVACTVPVMFLGTLLGGIDPELLLGSMLVTVGVAVLGCALALTLSVWATKTHEVLLASLTLFAVWVLANPIWWALLSAWTGLGPAPEWLAKTNPFILVFGPGTTPGL